MALEPSPAAEVDVSMDLVRELLVDQHPDLADLPLREVPSGWDNVIARIGDDLVARLPRREAAVALIHHEQRWLPDLAPALPLPVPDPVRTGVPGRGFPWRWSICRWMPGRSALDQPPTDPATAVTLGAFLAALHRPAPPNPPPNPYRGVPLAVCDPVVRDRLDRLSGEVDAPALRALWERLVTTPPWSGPPLWIHGDLHPGNLVVHDGALTGVIDFGDIAAGDPATDLAVAWTLLSAKDRAAFRAAAGRTDDPDTWARARAWAVHLGCAYLLSSSDRPEYGAMGRRALSEALADER
ncbi:MAG: aminoglycoside phosphotransferase family protein [Iamia sp.]